MLKINECKKPVIKNFTPHPISLYNENCQKIILTIPNEGVARLQEKVKKVHVITLEGKKITVVHKDYEEVIDLPQPQENVFYAVSVLVALASDRIDLIAPDTGKDSVVRDGKGMILGVRRFQTVVKGG